MRSAFLLIVFGAFSTFAQEDLNLCKRKPYLAMCQDEASNFESSRQGVDDTAKVPKNLPGKADVTVGQDQPSDIMARKKREISTEPSAAVEERRKELLDELRKLDDNQNDVRRTDTSSDYYRYYQSQGCANPCVYPYGSYNSRNYFNGGGYSQYYPSSSYGSSSSYYPYSGYNSYYPYNSGSYGGYPGYYSSGGQPFNLGLGSGLNIGIPGLPGGFGIGSGFGVTVGKR